MGALRIRQRQSGFTLIELMVVVAIVAFVSAAVVPSMSLSLLRNRQREAANLVVQGVFAARSRAARTGRCQQVSFHLGEADIRAGRGGAVSVLGSQQGFRCSQAQALADFQVLWVKAVSGGNYEGGNRVGLIGDDVAVWLAQTVDASGASAWVFPNNVVSIFFEPSGGMMNGQNVTLFIPAYDRAKTLVGNWRCVRISSGGSVKYGLWNGLQCG